MQLDESIIRNVVAAVLSEVGPMPAGSNGPLQQNVPAGAGHNGVFTDVNEAVAAAKAAHQQLRSRSMEERKQVIDIIRRISIDQCEELGLMEMRETGIGRPEHKIEKLRTLGER
ncbi:aldehyde dehydrogenase family protein, partial [Rhodopirellula sallentina]